MNPALEFIVGVGSGALDEAPAFLGSGFLVAPDRVLTCRHVVQELTPYGQPTDAVRNAMVVQAGDGPWVAVVDTVMAEATDLVLLTLRAVAYSHHTWVAPL